MQNAIFMCITFVTTKLSVNNEKNAVVSLWLTILVNFSAAQFPDMKKETTTAALNLGTSQSAATIIIGKLLKHAFLARLFEE